MCLITRLSLLQQPSADKSLIHSSTLTPLLTSHVLLDGTAVACTVWATGGSEQLVTASLKQMIVCLFTVEAPPPDGLVREV